MRLQSEVNKLRLALKILAGSSVNGSEGLRPPADTDCGTSFSETSTVCLAIRPQVS